VCVVLFFGCVLLFLSLCTPNFARNAGGRHTHAHTQKGESSRERKKKKRDGGGSTPDVSTTTLISNHNSNKREKKKIFKECKRGYCTGKRKQKKKINDTTCYGGHHLIKESTPT
jgi:hypothetical protein